LRLSDDQGHLLWRATPDDWAAVRDQQGDTDQPIRFQGQYHDEESGLYYNRYRYYAPDLGRYVSQDPIGLLGGMNGYGYVEEQPSLGFDPLGLEVAVTIWQPVGWGESSFGHVSTNINGTTYSFGPAGMKIIPTETYVDMNSFREGQAVILDISKEQEVNLQQCLSNSRRKYNFLDNNCGTPIQECLSNIGIETQKQIMPVSLGNKLIDMGIAKSYRNYAATKPSNGSSAPWAH
ncbi:RHS repeat-associated core domain-containing protein, partial [Pseudomonas sp. RIT-PI-AD]|uniref:RHS repeat-associated core domain-containing protein n=1 Tax=Pseudomonas sp. RIT-PI-AD TaxID=3035294 RepID=UPI0023EE93A9